jgi:hypothetical protein
LLPKTYLLSAPLDADDAFGQGLHHVDLALKLKACNKRIEIPLPESCPWWYPGKKAGMTSIWVGEPFKPTSKKVCAFHLGMLPEFTQIDDQGNIMRRGWRAVLSKAIKAKAIRKAVAERIFKTTLDYDGFDGACVRCRREGTLKRGSPKDGLCDLHREMSVVTTSVQELKKEKAWLKQQSPDRQKKHSSPQLRPMVVLGR